MFISIWGIDYNMFKSIKKLQYGQIAVLFLQAVFLTALISGGHYLIWRELNKSVLMINSDNKVKGFSYSPYQKNQNPDHGDRPTDAQIDKDLSILHEKSDRVRTYSALENAYIPQAAEKLGMTVSQGIWLGTNPDINEKEIQAGIELAKQNRNIDMLIVGNETLLRGDLNEAELIADLQRVKQAVGRHVIVTTAEPWHIWMSHPDLVKNVDRITVHLLPFDEGIPIEQAVGYSMKRYDDLREQYPRKRILIGETGWPSRGQDIKASHASIENEARFIREFLVIAQKQKLNYFLMEGFDQPWKGKMEGWAGSYWGMYNADRQPKFQLNGPVTGNLYWKQKAIISSILSILPIFIICLLLHRWKMMGRFWISAFIQLSFSVLVIGITLPKDYYMSLTDLIVLVGLISGMATTCLVLMVNSFEVLEVLSYKYWNRSFSPKEPLEEHEQDFVSIHLACCNEPPQMVIETIASLEKLDYANYEVLVIDNNTKDEALWKPVEEYMATLDSQRFRFFHLPQISGFKAGALNFGLKQTSEKAQVVAVVDADYVVHPDWLSTLVPHFDDTKTAVVQAPQAHRLWENNPFKRWANWEFDGFFRIGMHHRNERNALIQHGTMTMVRKSSLEQVGGWNEDCICEDTELGLSLLEKGYELQYVDKVFGTGLTPSDFAGLKSQRFRWAFGAMQILKSHWSQLVGKSDLTLAQKYHFLTGWIPWISEMFQFSFALCSIFWTIAMLVWPGIFNLPVITLLSPVLALLFCKSVLGLIAYRVRVKCSWKDIIGTSIASVALSHSIALGVTSGLLKKHGTFVVTPKGWKIKKGYKAFIGPIREELLMLFALVFGGLAYLVLRPLHYQVVAWVVLLFIQSIPYWCALICQVVSMRNQGK
jgi:cellulose synthase/poly-beta-1,6-N-acetylglucosamine synthase-like glycosyltransferase/exo-beta-1,3-glucanase (GH17 family)